MPFVYDPRLRGSGYRDTDTGRVLSFTAVREQIDQMIASSIDVQVPLSQMAAEGTLAPGDWEQAMRQEIKDNYITQYLAGRGGAESMTQADWGSIGGMLAEQYRFLDDFADEVAAGVLTDSQIYARSQMYINSSREAYERALERSADERGYTDHRWVLSPVENCEDCLALAALGWIPYDQPFVAPSSGEETMPGMGDTLCLTNCKCHIEYSGDSSA